MSRAAVTEPLPPPPDDDEDEEENTDLIIEILQSCRPGS